MPRMSDQHLLRPLGSSPNTFCKRENQAQYNNCMRNENPRSRRTQPFTKNMSATTTNLISSYSLHIDTVESTYRVELRVTALRVVHLLHGVRRLQHALPWPKNGVLTFIRNTNDAATLVYVRMAKEMSPLAGSNRGPQDNDCSLDSYSLALFQLS